MTSEGQPLHTSGRGLLHAGHAAAACAIALAFVALREFVAKQRHPHHPGHSMLLFYAAGAAAIAIGLSGKLMIALHREREDAALEELLRHERAERGW